MYSARVKPPKDIAEKEEPEWVTFPCSPFGDSTPFDEIKISKNQQAERTATVVSRQSSYHQHMSAVEMIYGSPPDTSPYRDAPKTVEFTRESSPTSTMLYIPSVHQSDTVDSWFDRRFKAPKAPPVENRTVTMSTPARQTESIAKMEQGQFPNWETSPSVEDFDDELSEDSQKSSLYRIPWYCCLSVLCVALVIFFLLFLGLLIGTAIRGEPMSLQNIFSPDTGAVTSISSSAGTLPPTSSSISSSSGTWAPTVLGTSPSISPTTAPTFLNRPPSNITVGAYYYPWHGDDFHNGQGYLRKELNQGPTLGEYNDTDKEVIAQHLFWSRQANIQLWVTSWWGPNRLEDTNIRDVILGHKDLGDHQVGLFYETSGRIRAENNFSTSNVEGDIEYICKTYFDHPNYYRVDGRPVLFLYLTRKLETTGKMEEAVLLMRSVAEFWGHDIYLVGDHVFATAPRDAETFLPFLYLDAVTNYDVYGSMGATGYAGQEAVDSYYDNQHLWRQEARLKKCGFIPAVSPGYNDRGVRLEADHAPLSRRLASNNAEGSLFEAGLRRARYLVDDDVGNLLLVNSFNEWHEDSQIEPASGATASTPDMLTMGLEYTGYGELYLDLLRRGTADGFEGDAFWESDEESNTMDAASADADLDGAPVASPTKTGPTSPVASPVMS